MNRRLTGTLALIVAVLGTVEFLTFSGYYWHRERGTGITFLCVGLLMLGMVILLAWDLGTMSPRLAHNSGRTHEL